MTRCIKKCIEDLDDLEVKIFHYELRFSKQRNLLELQLELNMDPASLLGSVTNLGLIYFLVVLSMIARCEQRSECIHVGFIT